MSELINNESQRRKKALKELIKELHKGGDTEAIKKRFSQEFGSVSTEEISQIEQALVEEEDISVEEIQKLCDIHAGVMGSSVEALHGNDPTQRKGHPLWLLKEENARLTALIDKEIKPYLNQEGNHAILMLRVGIDRLSEIKKHYTRKEQLFFPYLEKKGITAPPQVMWGVDDEIRAKINHVQSVLNTPGTEVADVRSDIESLVHQAQEMVFKENNILIPLLNDKLNLYNFIKIDEGSDEIGFFLEAPKHRFDASAEEGEATSEEEDVKIHSGKVEFDAGALDPVQLNAILNTLPLDLTFVDAEGHVRYFTQGKERIFERPKTIIGRHVNMCHPPSSVDTVEKIVQSFKSGEKDSEAFWIQMRGKFIHIRYFAVRDKDGTYLGTLEMTQDITDIKTLEGEKRLLDDA